MASILSRREGSQDRSLMYSMCYSRTGRVDGVEVVAYSPQRDEDRPPASSLELPAPADVRPVRQVVTRGVVGEVRARPVDGGEQFKVVGVRLAHGL